MKALVPIEFVSLPSLPAASGYANSVVIVNNVPYFSDGTVWRDLTRGRAPFSNTATALSIVSNSVAIDLSLGDYFTLTVSANITSMTLVNPPAAGEVRRIFMRVTRDSNGLRTFTLPAGWTAAPHSAPGILTDFVAGANKVTDIEAWTLNGTDWTFFIEPRLVGTGTTNTGYIPRFSSATDLTNSLMWANATGVAIGTNTIPTETRLFVYGGTNGANIDARGEPSYNDQAVLDLQGSDFETEGRSLYFRYSGPNAVGTIWGLPAQNFSEITSGADNFVIQSLFNVPIRFRVDGVEVFQATKTGITTSLAITGVTAAPGTDNTSLATTAFVQAAVAAAGGGLSGFTSTINTAAPNATVPVHQVAATGAQTNIDIAITPKGTGALTAQIANSAVGGGNKRGVNATDWQRFRAAATAVASGEASTIGGGQSNTASAIQSTVSGGESNTASGTRSTVSGGQSNIASGVLSTVCGGESNTASGSRSTVSGGFGNVANGAFSWIPGGDRATTRSITGASAWTGVVRSSAGDNQHLGVIVQITTTDATATILTANRSTGTTATVNTLPNNSVWAGPVWVVARDTSGNTATWLFHVLGKRGANAAATSVVNVQTVHSHIEAGLSGVACTVVANTTRGSLEIQVTGLAATTIDWCGEMFGVQVAR